MAEGLVRDEASLHDWLETQIKFGSLRNDCVLLIQAWRHASEGQEANDLAQLAAALSGSAERYLEINAQGKAFVEGLKAWDGMITGNFAQPHILSICVGEAAGSAGINAATTCTAFAHSQISNQLQVAIRLSLIGQTGAARILAQLENALSHLVDVAAEATLDQLGTSAFHAEIMAMKHQYMPARMFRS